MIIKVREKNSERQSPVVTIDTSTCHHPYAIRDALKLALELDGYDKDTINDVLGLQEDVKVAPRKEPETTPLNNPFEKWVINNGSTSVPMQDENLGTVFVPRNWVEITSAIKPSDTLKIDPDEKKEEYNKETLSVRMSEEQIKKVEALRDYIINSETIPSIQEIVEISRTYGFSENDSLIDSKPVPIFKGEELKKEILKRKKLYEDFETVIHMKYPRNQKYKRQRLSEFVENTKYPDLTEEFKKMIHTVAISKNADDLRIDKNGAIL